MRNREQIYGQEAAELLRNITVYHCMRRDQLLCLYPGKEGVIENLLRYLVKQQRIFYNTDRDCYDAGSGWRHPYRQASRRSLPFLR